MSDTLQINSTLYIPLSEIEFSAIRAEGPGGQNVNKTSSAVLLRFTIASSSLPENVKDKLFKMRDHRITPSGDIIIKSQEHRSLLRNKEAALLRLKLLVEKALIERKKRKITKPKKSAIEKRLRTKKKRGDVKKMRGKVFDD